MNVWMLILTYYPYPEGGAERQCRKVVREFERRGHTCTVVTSWNFGFRARKELDGITEVRRLGIRGITKKEPPASSSSISVNVEQKKSRRSLLRRGVSFIYMLVHHLVFKIEFFFLVMWHRNEINVLHIHEAHWLAGFGFCLGRVFGIPAICKEAILPVRVGSKSKRVPLAGLWSRWGLRGNYIAMHDGIRTALINKGIPEIRIWTIPNGVDLPIMDSKVRDPNTVLYVGNFTQGVAHKAFDIIISAWAEVHRRLPQAILVMVGMGNSTEWQALAKKLGCFDTIRFEGRQSNMDPYYRTASLHILPSRKEGLSNALLEAQSYGLPSIVSNIPGNLAVVEHNYNGKIIPTEDVKALSESVVELLVDSENRSRMGRNSRLCMEKNFSMHAICEELLGCYRSIK